MWTFVKRLFTDEAAFVAAVRGLIALGGVCVATGVFPTTGNWWKVGLFVTALAHFIPAGQQNPPNGAAAAKKP